MKRLSLVEVPRWLVFSVAWLTAGLWGVAEEPSENAVKAAFVYNFAKFVDWGHLPNSREELVLGVLGDKPLGGELRRLAGRSVGGRRFRVVQVDSQSMAECDLIYVGRFAPLQEPLVKKCLESMRVVTISDRIGFADEGGGVGSECKPE